MKREEPIKAYRQLLQSLLLDNFTSAILTRRPELKPKWDSVMRSSIARVNTLRGLPDYRKWIDKARRELKRKPQNVRKIVEEGLDKFELSPRWLHIIAEDVMRKKFPKRYSEHVNFVGTGKEVDVVLNKTPIIANKWWEDNKDVRDVYFSINAYLADIIEDKEQDIKLDIDDMVSIGKMVVKSKKSKATLKEFIASMLETKARWYEMYHKEGLGYAKIAFKEYHDEYIDEETRLINRIKIGVHWYANKYNLPLRDGRKKFSKGISRIDITP